ncbi:DEAD-box ATP-dependent RNA helicase 39-like [Zingiber officinale]|uniref:DEAD-box ATP-dependent RNA helicase 39-like n=1 Tax=Zingiber officinale TaxID=94328 RepID=UPI001C4BFF2B|nr:DEAD-box ATP-dependent RNA helicase 39-like [Zingiber officinale]XP_042427799.1 DEAD-box ATP-dependent RNA helicase 39-like [Zingiber officinale]
MPMAMAMAASGAAGKALFSASSSLFFSRTFRSFSNPRLPPLPRLFPVLARPLCLSSIPASAASTTTVEPEQAVKPLLHSVLLERLRHRHLKDQAKGAVQSRASSPSSLPKPANVAARKKIKDTRSNTVDSFEELDLSDEVMGAVKEIGISVPTEIQCIAVPAILEGKSVALGSHTGSGKTLAYMLPIVQLMRHDEEVSGKLMKSKRPRVVVLCPTRELCEQVFHVAKSISHHARFRSTMISGGGRLRPQEDSLSEPIDMVVGTPGRILQHINEGNMVYGDIKYLVLDEADTMFDQGFGPDIRKFLGPLKSRAEKPGDQGFQTVLVTATMTKAVQKLIDEEFQGIIHLRTSSFQKKVASARHDFIKLSGAENKLEALLQVLQPSLVKGNRVMVFCNTLNSSRAVDHFLGENQIFTVNYHGEVPAEERVENLKKFKSDDGDCPTLVCTDLAARGLDLAVDHVIMFDFPKNSIDYLHRTGRTARMGAKGKVTSLVAKKDLPLATRIEEALKKNQSLESLSINTVKRDAAISRQINKTYKMKVLSKPSSKIGKKDSASPNSLASKKGVAASPSKTKKGITLSRANKSSSASRRESPKGNKLRQTKTSGAKKAPTSKLSVVGFRGRSSAGKSAASKNSTRRST